jgi:hypothetical protein
MPDSRSFKKRKLSARSADKAGRGVRRRQNVVHFPGEDEDNQTGRPPETDEGKPERLDPVGLILSAASRTNSH